MEPPQGIGPWYDVYKTPALPLSYRGIMVACTRLELVTVCLRGNCSAVELASRMVLAVGFEPTKDSFWASHVCQLHHASMVLRLGIEPRLQRSERRFLPLEDLSMALRVGVEPTPRFLTESCTTIMLSKYGTGRKNRTPMSRSGICCNTIILYPRWYT